MTCGALTSWTEFRFHLYSGNINMVHACYTRNSITLLYTSQARHTVKLGTVKFPETLSETQSMRYVMDCNRKITTMHSKANPWGEMWLSWHFHLLGLELSLNSVWNIAFDRAPTWAGRCSTGRVRIDHTTSICLPPSFSLSFVYFVFYFHTFILTDLILWPIRT